MEYLLLQDGKLVAQGTKKDIGKYLGYNTKEQRNKEQNKKYWKLINQLSLVLKIGVEELHFKMLKDYSVRYEILVPDDYEIRGIEYYERKSKIKKGDKEFIVYHVYTPSHELRTDEFALLLEGLVRECENVGIPTIID